MIGLSIILGGAALHRLPAAEPPPPPPCPNPVLLERAGRLSRLCMEGPRVPLGQVLARAGMTGCMERAPEWVAAGDLIRPGAGCAASVERAPASTRLALGLRLDLNRADEQDLAALPRIGPALARRIVEDRARRGPFSSVATLERVKGIGPATMAWVRGFLSAGSAAAAAR